MIYSDGTKISYAYNARSQLVSISNGPGKPLANYAYNPLGQVAQVARDNGVATHYTYDMAGQLTDLSHEAGSTTLASSHYTLDAAGRRTAQTREDNLPEHYSYDATSQLTGVNYGAGRSETFVYDAVGNRTTSMLAATSGTAATSYQTNLLNQYTSVSGVSVTYDVNGNLLNDGKQSYRYDAQNRLIGVQGASVAAEFYYDPRNRCVLRRYYNLGSQGQWILNTADSRALTYDTAWNLLTERTLDGSIAGQYVFGLRTDEILKAQLNDKQYYPLADGLRSTVAVANEKGEVVDRVRYDVYGAPHFLTAVYKSKSTLTSGLRFLFTGREWLGQLGINDHRFRYYSPLLGRWLNPDMLGVSGGINLYVYARNNVLNLNDFLGLCCSSTDSATESGGGGKSTSPDKSSPEWQAIQSKMNSKEESDRVEAMMLALAYFQISHTGVTNEFPYPKFEATQVDTGLTTRASNGSSIYVTLGPDAFEDSAGNSRSPGRLGSTLAHEFEVHVGIQIAKGTWAAGKGENSPEALMNEVEAWDYELNNATRFGLTEQEKAEVKAGRDEHYNRLSDQNKNNVDHKKYCP